MLWLLTRKTYFYMVADPVRGLLNRKKRMKIESLAAHSNHANRSEEIKYESHDASTCLGAKQVSVRLELVQGSFSSSTIGQLVSLRMFYASLCDNNFPSFVASLFFWRYLAASISSFLHAAMNLRPPCVTVSTHTSASNAVAF